MPGPASRADSSQTPFSGESVSKTATHSTENEAAVAVGEGEYRTSVALEARLDEVVVPLTFSDPIWLYPNGELIEA